MIGGPAWCVSGDGALPCGPIDVDSTWDDLVTDGGTVDAWATVDAVKAEKGGDFALDDVSKSRRGVS